MPYVEDWMRRAPDDEIGNTAIRAIDLATRAVTTLPREVAPHSSVCAADQQGHLFVVDNGRVVRRIDLATMQSTTLLGDDREAGVRLDELSHARLNNVTGIAVSRWRPRAGRPSGTRRTPRPLAALIPCASARAGLLR